MTTRDPIECAVRAIAQSDRAFQLLASMDLHSPTLHEISVAANDLSVAASDKKNASTLDGMRLISLKTADLNQVTRRAFNEVSRNTPTIYGTGGPIEPHDPSACRIL